MVRQTHYVKCLGVKKTGYHTKVRQPDISKYSSSNKGNRSDPLLKFTISALKNDHLHL